MALHQAHGADWDQVLPGKRNRWQKLAAATYGIVTPANGVSIAGAALVFWGLYAVTQDLIGWGTLAIILGRIGDVLDGAIAERTKTKSPLGEAIDASFDKIIMLVTMVVLLAYDVLPLLIGLALIFHTAYNSAVALRARARKIALHPSLLGKGATALAWFSVGWFLLAAVASDAHDLIEVLCQTFGWLTFINFAIIGLISSRAYARQYQQQAR